MAKKNSCNKTTKGKDDDKKKKKLNKVIERIWSTSDEIAILKGSFDFKEGNSVNIKKFYSERKESLQLEATYDQVRHKVRKLRDKYRSNEKKLNKGIKLSYIFSEPHEKILFDLSEKIWGNSGEKNTLEHALGVCVGNKDAVKMGMKLVDKSKNEELERRWKALNDEEMKLFLKRKELVNELVEACMSSASASTSTDY